MTDNIEDMLDEYDALASDVANSKHAYFQSNLQQFFAFIDQTPTLKNIVTASLPPVDFKKWFDEHAKIRGSMVGSGMIDWPINRTDKLAVQVALFQAMADGSVDPPTFSLSFAYSGTNLNDMIGGIVDQLFNPMSRDLRRLLQRGLSSSSSADIPASDRTVLLNHNSEPYKKTVRSIGELIGRVEEKNDYPDQSDKEQRLAELRAGQELLKAPQVSEQTLRTGLMRTLKYLADKFIDQAVGILAGAVLAGLLALLGHL